MATATAAMVTMTAALMTYAIFNFHFFHSATFRASDLIAVFTSLGARCFLPNMMTNKTFEYTICHFVIPSANQDRTTFHKCCCKLDSSRLQDPLKRRPRYMHRLCRSCLIESDIILQADGFHFLYLQDHRRFISFSVGKKSPTTRLIAHLRTTSHSCHYGSTPFILSICSIRNIHLYFSFVKESSDFFFLCLFFLSFLRFSFLRSSFFLSFSPMSIFCSVLISSASNVACFDCGRVGFRYS